MGANCVKELEESKTDYDFVGRKNELNEVLALVDQRRLVEIYGLCQIGKSRLLKQLILKLRDEHTSPKRKLLYFDFYLYQGDPKDGLIESFNEGLVTFDHVSYVSKVNDLNECKKMVRFFKQAVKDGIKENEEVIIFLDNLHVIAEAASEKQIFLSFVRDIILETNNLKFVVTTYEKIGFRFKGFVSYELPPMTYNEILKLIHNITEEEYKDDENYMPVLAKLCSGLPLAAMITATELIECHGFMKPCDMVQTFFLKRVEAMSCDMYPTEDKINIYMKPIEKVSEMAPYLAQTLRQIAEKTSGTNIPIEDAVQATGSDAVEVIVKQNAVKLNINGGILYNLRDKTICLNGVLRECTLAIDLDDSIENLPEDKKQEYQEMIRKKLRKIWKENVIASGLDVPDDAFENPKKLEEYVLSLATPCENKDVDDDSTDTKTEVDSLYQEKDISNMGYAASATLLEQNNLDQTTVSSSTDSRCNGAQAEDKIMNSDLGAYRMNIPSDYPSDTGPQAMSYKSVL